MKKVFQLTLIGIILVVLLTNCDEAVSTQQTTEGTTAVTVSQTQPQYPEVEAFKLTWPEDLNLCDRYLSSNGSLEYTIYRLKDTKTIIGIYEEGAFCQGDSEYASYMTFDRNGLATRSYSGGNDYTETTITLYEQGKAKTKYIYEPYPQENSPKQTTTMLNAEEATHSKNIKIKIEDYRKEMTTRVKELKQLIEDGELSAEELTEAKETIQTLERNLTQPITYKADFVLRQPTSDETCLLRGTEIPLMETASSSSKELGKVSHFEEYIEVKAIKDTEKEGRWYHISYYTRDESKRVRGWVAGKFVTAGIYPK